MLELGCYQLGVLKCSSESQVFAKLLEVAGKTQGPSRGGFM